MRTSRKEEQVDVKSEGVTGAMRGQNRVGWRAGWRARQRARSAERNPAHGLRISGALDERKGRVITSRQGKVKGSIYDRTEGKKSGAMGVQVQARWRAVQRQRQAREGRKKNRAQMAE